MQRRSHGSGSIITRPGTPNLYIRYRVNGRQIQEATGTTIRTVAEARLRSRLAVIRKARVKPALDNTAKFVTDSQGRNALCFGTNSLQVMWNPCVYAFYRGIQCLYVGSGRRGARPFDSKHHLADALKAADSLLVYPTETRKAAFKLESTIIEQLSPLHNVRRRKI